MCRPTELRIDDHRVRRDINSQNVLKTYPFLPMGSNPMQRKKYLCIRDTLAYEKIRNKFPNLVPPQQLVEITTEDRWKARIENIVFFLKSKVR